MRWLRWVLAMMACFCCFGAMGAKHYVSFDHYSTQNGLSCNFVTSIGQDNEGFLWVGTASGLNRFDGSNFKIYVPGSDVNLLRSDITSVHLFPKGNLFVTGPYGMLQSYDEPADSFDDRRFPGLTCAGSSWNGGSSVSGTSSRRRPIAQDRSRYSLLQSRKWR